MMTIEAVLGLILGVGFFIVIVVSILECIIKFCHKRWLKRKDEKKRKWLDKAQRRREQMEREAVCPFCGSPVQVDNGYVHNVCCYCNLEFDVKAAKLLVRAQRFLKQQDYLDSYYTYRQVLSIYPDSQFIIDEISRIDLAKEDHVFIYAKNIHLFSKDEVLEFRRNAMTYVKASGYRKIYYYDDMDELTEGSRGVFGFSYKESMFKTMFMTNVEESILVSFIEHAKQGLYPPYDWKVPHFC